MIDQIKLIPLDPNNFSSENYSSTDEALLTSITELNTFNEDTDYVEFFVYDLNNSIISPLGNDGTFLNYNILDNEIYVNPEEDLANVGVTNGIVNTLYNFFTKRLSSSPQSTYYISEISSDRTEIRLESNIISTEDIITSTTEFIAYREQDETFPDFYLNLGSNQLYIANNIRLDGESVLIKLYEPLPLNINVKTSLWVVEKISNGLAYRVEFPNQVIALPNGIQLQGPNINLQQKGELNNSTENVNLTSFTSPNSQSEYQINSYFNDPSVNINVDYTDFGNFVNFSSAKSRIENFWYKVGLIESASEQIASQSLLTETSFTSASLAPLNNLINDTITNFDRYEYYLYFESSSDTYPKTNSIPPYQNAPTGSNAAETWYDTKIEAADNYDNLNQDWLYYTIPEYVRSDVNNNCYFIFTDMIGQFVDDNIWIYLKDTTNKWDADNRIDAGVSKDLVAQVLRDMGVKLYQNNFSSTDLYSAFLGFTDSGSLFPFPNMTGSLPTPSGYEYISNFISSSDEAIPLDDINKRIYKRIYHNLPYLLKSKGTVAGLRTLITSYGIPDTILRISEFGGKDKNNVNDWDLWKHQYNYKADKTTDRSYITSNWQLNTDWGVPVPQTLQFRFNAGLPSGSFGIVEASQSLWQNNLNTSIVLEYDTDLAEIPVADTYSGSIVDPTYQYATLKFTPDNFNNVASVTLPFLDGGWWNVSVTTEGSNFILYAGNKIYSGSDGSQIGFFATSSITGDKTFWNNSINSWFPTRNGAATGNYEPFSGSYQEIRYFTTPLTENVFKDYVMNPQSTEGNGINGSADQLAFRASLGGELYTGSVSIHPKVSGPTGYPTSSFASDSNFTTSFIGFNTNREWVFYDSPAVGIKNRNTDKIKRQDLILPSGDTLSNQKSIQQKSYTTDDYTNNLNLLEVAFSPQNQINDDIISQIGHFNIGDYIGDPRLVSSSADTYPSLVDLSKEYFEKYTSSYDVYDYIRLIKFFDNSLFKMVKDFVPSRTGLASGIVVKQHILERQKYPTPQPTPTTTLAISHTTGSTSGPSYQQVKETRKDLTLTGSVGSTPSLIDGARYYEATTDFESNPLYTFSGGAGGSVNDLNVPVGFFRAVDTLMPPTTLSTTPTTLFKNGTIVNGTISNNGVAISPKGIIENTGKFTIDSNYTFKGDINVEVKNSTTQRTMVLELVEDNNGIVSSIQKLVPITTGATYTSLTLTNCIFEAGKTYYFQLKTTTGTTNIIGVTRVNFVQQDAPLTFRSGQMYSEVIKTPLGDVTETVSNSHEFYDGEFSGSAVLVTDGELNTECDTFKKADTTEIQYYLSSSVPENTSNFINTPGTGAAYTMMDSGTNDGLKIYLQWAFDRKEAAGFGTQADDYYWNVVGFAIKIPESANAVEVEDYITSLKKLKLLDVNFIGSDVTGLTGWSSISNKTFTNAVDPILIPKSFRRYDAYSNSGRFIYVETQPSEMEFSLRLNTLFGTEGDLYNFNIASKGLINTAFEPFVPQTFQNSDCNPLVNNATDITPSTVYYDVDYASNPNVAVNFDTILAGSAPKAKIQDFNYHSNRSIIPRYKGSKNGTTTEYNVTNTSIDLTQALFGYFNWVGGTAPEWGNGLEDRSVANLRFLLDVNGKIIKPIADSQGINQGIVENNFTEGKIATLAFDDETGSSAAFSNLLGDHTIFKSGKDIVPIIYSQTESISSTSSGGYTGSLIFGQGDQNENASIEDYRLRAFSDASQLLSNDNTDVEFGFEQYLGASGSFSTDTTYSNTSTGAGDQPNELGITLEFKAYLQPQFATGLWSNTEVVFQFMKNSTLVGNSVTLRFDSYDGVFLSYFDSDIDSSDDIKLVATAVDYGQGGIPSLSNSSFFKVFQTPPPGIGAVGPDATSNDYWIKGGIKNQSGSERIQPNALGPVYGQKQEDITGSGFFGITNDFLLQVGDEFRFQGTETQTYKIIEVDEATTPPTFVVDRYVNLTNTEMDWFLVRRYVDNPANIILEVDKPAGGTSPGILKPQYLSKDAEDNIDTILEQLRRDSLI